MIEIKLNGVITKTHSTCLNQALIEWKLKPNTFALALNHHFIPRHEYGQTYLKSQDEIEILIAMQGG